jgi:carboxypeptidase Q
VQYRGRGAIYAAEKGAVACLVRSVTAKSLCTPHTGAMRYDEAVQKIPAAAITTEDADMIARFSERGVSVVVNLKMEANTLPDAESANVVAELRGREKPEEIVVIGGHIDAWDVGHGAHDDGAGCVMAMEAISVLRKLNMIPRRTIRVVLWTNEENGLAGGKAYAREHEAELPNHVAAIESDSGGFKPTGYSVECSDDAREALAALQLDEILGLVSSIGPMKVKTGHSGADISPMEPAGVVLMGHNVEGSTYFDYHHTPADTIDKVDPRELSENVAVMAAMAYVLADMPGRIGVSSSEAPEDRPTK